MYDLFRIPVLALAIAGFACAGTAAVAENENPAAALWNKLMTGPEEPATRQSPAKPAAPADTPYRRQIQRANENTVSIVSGNPNGSLLSMADDIAQVLDSPDKLRILPIVGKGAAQNIRDVLFLRGVDLAFVRSNALSSMSETELPGIKDKLVYITSLFNAEMHIYARPEIRSLQDLNGKRVNFSDQGSGSQFTTREVFKALGVVSEEVNMGQADGIEAMRRNEIVATVIEGGKPTNVFRSLGPEDNFHFLSVDYAPELRDAYFPAELTHDDYPRLIPEGTTIATIASSNILVAYNWPEDSERYKVLARFTEALFQNFEKLHQPPRHPKWREVSPMAEYSALKRFEPAAKWIEQHKKQNKIAQASDPKVQSEFDKFVSASGDGAAGGKDRERLFNEFVEWRRRGSTAQ